MFSFLILQWDSEIKNISQISLKTQFHLYFKAHPYNHTWSRNDNDDDNGDNNDDDDKYIQQI